VQRVLDQPTRADTGVRYSLAEVLATAVSGNLLRCRSL